MPVSNSDAILWYRVGIFGDAGYAIPNWSDDVGSLNPQIVDWVDLVGRNLFHIMHHEDVDLRIPPSLNTAMRIHKLYLRASTLLAGRAVPSGELQLEVQHARLSGEMFRVYPIPYFKVRNPFMRRWAGLILMSLSEAMQHTENRKEMEISTAFAGQVGQYITRVYQNMAIELFGKSRQKATERDFLLRESDFKKYNPAEFFTSTEMVDTVPRLDRVFTEDKLETLSEGIPIPQLPSDLGPWPTNLSNLFYSDRQRADSVGSPSAHHLHAEGHEADPIMPPPPAP